ncbi:MAG TPA: MBL fold metallo-hydrolase [Patescibacteria group bacterium]
MKKYLACLVALVILTAGLVIRQWPDQHLHLVMCDIGQGDAILMWQGFTQVLIDAGKTDQVVECLTKYLPFWDRNLELVIATHADSDHIGGFVAVGERYDFSYVLSEPLGKETEVFTGFSELVSRKQQQGTTVILPTPDTLLTLANRWTFKILSPREQPYLEQPSSQQNAETHLWDAWVEKGKEIESSNNRSIVLLATYHAMDILLTGDLEEPGEQALISQGLLADIEVLKIGHHGAKTSTTEGFLTALRPEIALISSGKNNQYGHPAPEVVKKIEEIGAKILRTDQKGDIHLVSDGSHLWLQEE